MYCKYEGKKFFDDMSSLRQTYHPHQGRDGQNLLQPIVIQNIISYG